MMVTLLVYAYFVGIRSSRKIAAACERNLAFRAIVGKVARHPPFGEVARHPPFGEGNSNWLRSSGSGMIRNSMPDIAA
jgi:hypothetical protein